MSLSAFQNEFPQLAVRVRDNRLVYLDNAATTLMPRIVSNTMARHDLGMKANVHRGAHYLSDLATGAYEKVREDVARFLGAHTKDEVIFTKGTTEGINLVAQSYVRANLREGDEILITEMEHHSNIVPWQLIAREKGLVLRVVPVTDQGELDMEAFRRLLGPRTKFVSVVSVSNTLGTVNPVAEITRAAHAAGAKVLVDAAQSVAALASDVRALDCDFLVFSAHKIFGPFGVGVLWGRLELLQEMPPYQGGGSMISTVSFEGTDFLPPPHRFEAGTPNVTGVIGLGASVEFLSQFSWDEIASHEKELLSRAANRVHELGGIRWIGTSKTRMNILSFVIDGTHPSDVGNILDQQGIAVRTGHHCTQPLMKRFGVPGTIRASFSIYNTEQDVDLLVQGLIKAKELLT